MPWNPTANKAVMHSTGARKIEAAVEALVNEVVRVYPDSTFAKWWKDAASSDEPVATSRDHG